MTTISLFPKYKAAGVWSWSFTSTSCRS